MEKIFLVALDGKTQERKRYHKEGWEIEKVQGYIDIQQARGNPGHTNKRGTCAGELTEQKTTLSLDLHSLLKLQE